MNQQKVVAANAAKPSQPIPIAVQEHTVDIWKEFERTMKEMTDKSAQEMQLRDQQREIESYVGKFSEISGRLQSCREAGIIRYLDISDLQHRVCRILNDSRLRSIKQFQEHIEYVEETLVPFLEELRIEYRESRARRLEFNPSDEITSGLEMLRNSAHVSATQ